MLSHRTAFIRAARRGVLILVLLLCLVNPLAGYFYLSRMRRDEYGRGGATVSGPGE